MLECDGYRMFHGTVHISPVVRPDGTRWKEPFDLRGTWLSKPGDDGWWICQPEGGGFTESWGEEIMSNIRDDAEV